MSKFLFSKKKSIEIFDLGLHPFADTFISKKYLDKKEPEYPLKCRINLSTGCIFNQVITHDKKRYNLYDYSYTSSNSNYSKNYWQKYALDFSKKYLVKGKIFEIGCNDGFLLEQFKKFGYEVSGCDASKFITKISKKKNLNIFYKIFNFKNSSEIKKKNGKFNFIIANNVVNHSNNPNDFIKGVKNILDKDGFFIFEQPYWVSMMNSKKIDQIYHEHITYFTLKFSDWILRQNGMYIHDYEITEYHGGSLKVIAKKINKTFKKNKIKISNAIKKESKIGIFKKNYYKKINNFLFSKKKKILKNY